MKVLLFMLVMSASAWAQMPKIEPGVSHELAIWRAARYSGVRYKLNLTLEQMSPVLKGTIEIRVHVSPLPKGTAGPGGLSAVPSDEMPPIILDWRKIAGHEKDSTIGNVSVNGQTAVVSGVGENHPVAEASTPLLRKEGSLAYAESNEHLIFREGVKPGENVIKLDFTSPILTSGSAITRYVDKEDGAEYLYSLFVPSDASTAFPVFDQPDLKARFTLTVDINGRNRPTNWVVVSNTEGKNGFDTTWDTLWQFEETKPISTYVFAFAAGPWQEFSGTDIDKPRPIKQPELKNAYKQLSGADVTGGNPSSSEGAPARSGDQKGTLPTGRVSASGTDPVTHIYVRKSQAAKFQPHAAEVFRLTREGIKYLEEYFDYKFPFPKYDIVLIPEFPFGGMEHAGATFLRESSIIFPSEPTANDYISRANVIFHETAHQWFGDTVTMKWFDDLWLKEGFAEFMAYKTLEHVMPHYNAWKAFYERNKQAAYLTDSTKGTTAIYQPIENLSAAKSAYGNIVYRKAPSFLRQAEFYLGPDKFQTAVRAFLKKHEFGNAGWEDLVKEFELSRTQDPQDFQALKDRVERGLPPNLSEWARQWVTVAGVPVIRTIHLSGGNGCFDYGFEQRASEGTKGVWTQRFIPLVRFADGNKWQESFTISPEVSGYGMCDALRNPVPVLLFSNYQDYGYGIFLLDDKSRDYVLKNIQNEKDDFLRSMMWGALWDSVREAELEPKEYVELAVKNLPAEKDEMITASVLGRVSTAMTYYMPSTEAERVSSPHVSRGSTSGNDNVGPSLTVGLRTPADDLRSRLEAMLTEKMRTAATLGQRVTYYRAFLNIASTQNARKVLKDLLGGNPSSSKGAPRRSGDQKGTLPTGRVSAYVPDIPLKTKDRFDIVTKLAVLNDPEAPNLLADLERSETGDDAKRYAYAAHAAFPTKENRERSWNDFVNNKNISESWIEAAMGPFNSPRNSDLSLPYLERALKELPNLKRNRKIFFVNGWLGAFIGGQKSQAALDIVNKFLADNPNLDKDLRLKILENVDVIERAVKIRSKYGARDS